MPSADGPQGPDDLESKAARSTSETVEMQLFESLVHHLIEKGVLTRNDALSVVQTVAEVHRGRLDASEREAGNVHNALTILERLYSSLNLVTERPLSPRIVDGGNVLQLRPPLHGDRPKFPKDD